MGSCGTKMKRDQAISAAACVIQRAYRAHMLRSMYKNVSMEIRAAMAMAKVVAATRAVRPVAT